MNDSIYIRCRGCGHKQLVNKELIRNTDTSLKLSDGEELINKLRSIQERFVCKQCKQRDSEIIRRKDSPYKNDTKNTRQHSSSVSKKKRAKKPSRMVSRKLKNLLKKNAWLYKKERSLLESFQKQISSGRGLSEKQISIINKIRSRVNKRQRPKVFLGGAPGLGGR